MKRARLTPKQAAFVRLVLGGEHSRAKAYRLAYGGPDAEPEFDDAAKAADALKSPAVREALKVARAMQDEVAACSVSEHVAQLERLREAALCDGRFSAAVTAEVARGKVAGLYTDRLEVSGGPAAPIDLADFAGVSPQDAAAAYGKLIK